MLSLPNWKMTDLGSEIALYAACDLNLLKGQRPLLMMGGIHGDEPLGVLLAQKTLAMLEADAKSPRPEYALPWILIPVLNVDGYRHNTRVNGRGVDLNRNYPASSWVPESENKRYCPGPSPGSEAEIKAVVELIRIFKPRLIIHCHSWKPMIVCAGPAGLKDAQRLSRSSGYEIVPDIGYPTPGSLSRYGWIDHRIPVICIEESDDSPPGQVWPRFAEGMHEIFLDASDR
jgi:protein MpaA